MINPQNYGISPIVVLHHIIYFDALQRKILMLDQSAKIWRTLLLIFSVVLAVYIVLKYTA